MMRNTGGKPMRTTIDIEDDVLLAAKEIAREQHVTLGSVVSELARRSLNQPIPVTTRNGFPQLPVRDKRRVVTLELVNKLRDESP
jgi:hypothetical protein